MPDDPQVTWKYPKRAGDKLEFGYPLLRLLVIVECGTRAVLAACFGPETDGELSYATRLLHCLNDTMLLLADAGFDAVDFLADTAATGAQFLVRSGARRRPTILRRLPDGSYLARLSRPYRAGTGYRMLQVRIIETQVTITLADGTVRTEPWRLVTSLLDATTYPASELVSLYHRRWQVETAYFSIKATMLDGRILRSRSISGLDQEVYALLTAYQALVRTGCDAVATQQGVAAERISFTVLLTEAGDTVTTARALEPEPGNAPASRPAPARTPPASTARMPDSTRQPPRTTPSTPTSRSSRQDLRPAHIGKRNGVTLLAIL